MSLQREDEDSDLFQWYHGSKFCTGILESLVTLEEHEDFSQFIEVKVRGPKYASQECFYFMEEILRYLQDVIKIAMTSISFKIYAFRQFGKFVLVC